MVKFTIAIFCTLCSMAYTSSYAQNSPVFSVAKFKDDKTAALTYTFDDGLREHYTKVFPVLKAIGFKATFVINGSKINKDQSHITDTTRMAWDELKEMAVAGQEISNHGWAHKNFGRFPLHELKEDIDKNDSAILAHTGIMPRTFAYPNNTKTPEGVALASQNRVGTRLFQRSVGGKSTKEKLEKWVEQLLKNGEWGVGMTHGITYGYDHFSSPDIFWNHLKKVKALEDKIWVATFKEVASYIKERDSLHYDVEQKKDGITVKLHLALNDSLFTEPLTGVISKKSMKQVDVVQDGRKLKTRTSGEKILFYFDPFGGNISVKKKQ